ncbi:MAG: hypothetical protein ACYC2K_04230 [Gemmatimonadales bacterium]
MSALSRRFLITAALFLASGIGVGLWLLMARELLGRWPTPYQISVHTHLILVGAVIQTILGTALWLFPRPPRARRPRREWFGEVAWWAITLGTVARALAEYHRTGGPAWLAVAIVAGGAAQALGLVSGLLALRHRIRPAAERPPIEKLADPR